MTEPHWTTPPISIPSALTREMILHAGAGAPNEVCGVLACGAGAVTAVYPVANAAPDPRRYLMDAKGLLRAMLDIERRGWSVFGFYHSHPASAPVPSETDLALALYPDHCYAIVSLQDPDRPEIRFFLFREGRFEDMTILEV